MSLFLLLAAFFVSLFATKRGLGCGIVAVYAFGYVSGVIRANIIDVLITFMFDAAILGLYVGFFFGAQRRSLGIWSEPAGKFVLFLIAWPTLLSLAPVNHYLIQMVALRAAIWFLPVVMLAGRLTGEDVRVVARGLAVLNLMALIAGLYIYIFGVESLYPKNQVTKIIYNSNDITGGFHRIPSTFLNAHAYGGTMLLSLPFLLDRMTGDDVRLVDRLLSVVGVIAAMGGILMCGARTPLITLALSLAIAWALSRFSLKLGLIGAALVGGVVLVAGSNERFQRGSSLGDTEMTVTRIGWSVNSTFTDLLAEYPMGAGMGTAAGTSIPYFLLDVAPVQIGLENEYGRILVDQGCIGLVGWLAFLGWLYVRPPQHPPQAPWRMGVILMYSLTLAGWGTAFIGTGALTSIPATVLCLTQMGILASVRSGRSSILATAGPSQPPVRWATAGSDSVGPDNQNVRGRHTLPRGR